MATPERFVSSFKRPPSLLYREMQPDWRGLFSRLTELAASFDQAKWVETGTKLFSGLTSLFRLKPASLEEELFVLVKISIAEAIAAIAWDHSNPAKYRPRIGTERAVKNLDETLSLHPVELTESFFAHPAETPIVGVITQHLASWFRISGMPIAEASNSVLHYPAYFVRELEREYRENADNYRLITAAYSPTFRKPLVNEIAWLKYHSRLTAIADPEVLDLGVRLGDVYVELRAFCETRPLDFETGRPANRIVGTLSDSVSHWLGLESPDSALLIISGGPGSGKSAFARRFAAQTAWSGPSRWRVLYVPLHRFKPSSELLPTLTAFARDELNEQVDMKPLEGARLLIVFDGLDELRKQGKVGEETAADFYRQAEDYVKDCNRDHTPVRVKVLLCGRPVAVDLTRAERRKPDCVLHVLPFKLSRELRDNCVWQGLNSLVGADQRSAWWIKYQKALGVDEIGMPPELASDKLSSLTAEPMLNCLLARCMRNPDRTITSATSRSAIYEWLLEDVFHRVHDTAGNVHLAELDYSLFAQLMEEVAVAAWHSGDLRCTTHSAVYSRCKLAGIEHLLEALFPVRNKPDITALFLAFYFQESQEWRGPERAYEFTHQSFGEYLIARCIRRLLVLTQKYLVRERAWVESVALQRWTDLLGPAEFSDELRIFLTDIVSEHTKDAEQFLPSITTLINYSIWPGIPMHKLELPTYHEMERQHRNALVALLALHSVCARASNQITRFVWPGTGASRAAAIADWIVRIIGHQSSSPASARKFLNHLDFSGLTLDRIDFFSASCTSTRFADCNLSYANFSYAALDKAVFSNANLHFANLNHADCTNADFSRASLTNATLTHANLVGADLSNADLTGASYDESQLSVTLGRPAHLKSGKPPD